MIRKTLILCTVILLMTACSHDPRDNFDGIRDNNDEYTEPDYNVPRQIAIEDIETSGEISSLTIDSGISAAGDHYQSVNFALASLNSGVIIDFKNYNPFRYKGSGENGGYGITIELDYIIPENTYLDITFIPPVDSTIFQENIPIETVCYVGTDDCFLGNILDFTDYEIGLLKQKFQDNEFYDFKLSIIIRPIKVVTKNRIELALLDSNYWDLIFSNYSDDLLQFLNILGGTGDITTILEDNNVDGEIISSVNLVYVVSITNLGSVSDNSSDVSLIF
jgi:hypothetical protein